MLHCWRLLTITVCVFSLTFFLTYHVTIRFVGNGETEKIENYGDLFETLKNLRRKWQIAKEERENLSKRLNDIVRDYNLFRCTTLNDTTDTGAWCEWPLGNKHFTDESLALSMAVMFENKSLASFGDGPGHYKRLIKQTGFVNVYDAYDGSPYIESATNGEVKYLDLTIPHYGLPVYDYALSIEVAEHIPEEFENVYLSNLIRHARFGMVLSWAVPFQLGVGHVNPRPPEYVKRKMASLCFDVDSGKTNKLKRAATIGWIRQNLLVFSRRSDCLVDEEEA